MEDLESRKSIKRFTAWRILAAVLAVLIIGISSGLAYQYRTRGPIPETIKRSVGFPIYYPGSLPHGYKLDKKSTHFQNGILFISFLNKGNRISVSEQAAPKNPPDFEALMNFNTSFKKLDVPAGTAILGVDGTSKDPVAILGTNTTLINIIGTQNTPSDVINNLVKSLSSLPQ